MCLVTSINRTFLRFMLRMCPSAPSCRVDVFPPSPRSAAFFLSMIFGYLAAIKIHIDASMGTLWKFLTAYLEIGFLATVSSLLRLRSRSVGRLWPPQVPSRCHCCFFPCSHSNKCGFSPCLCTSFMRSYCKRWYLESDNHRNCFVEYLPFLL